MKKVVEIHYDQVEERKVVRELGYTVSKKS